jgi:hypothetical protein
MPKHLTIDDIIARFAEQLREAVRTEIERHAADLVKTYVPTPRKPNRNKGLPVAQKPCPVCGEMNARRRFRNYCAPHTPAGVGAHKPKALDLSATVTSGSADV